MTETIGTDVVVVGGGAMGSAAAWQLARRGVQVALLEQFETGHTNGASHGASRIFRLSYADLSTRTCGGVPQGETGRTFHHCCRTA